MHNKLRITRYNKTRNWAIWANEELLAVTVYRKGAQAVLDYIHTLTQNTIETNTMSKTKTTAAATTTSTEFDPTIIKAVNGEGKTIRIKFDPLGVSVCYNLKGKWSAHEIYNQPLPELIAEGVFTIEDADSQKTYDKYFTSGKKNKRNAKRSKAKKQKKSEAVVEVEQDEQPTATIEEAPQIDAAEEAAAAEINEEVEAALWQEIEEAREAEQLAEVTMEAQDEEAAEADEESAEPAAEEPESNEPVTDVEPTAEAPAQESAAEAAQPEATKPAKHKTCNVILNGAEEACAIPEGYAPAAGDLLIRNYKGEAVEVFVVAKGQYEWNGEVYPTLTHISWKVAGYQISGNTFFGLPIKPRKG